MKLNYEITVFALVSTLGLYLILNLVGALLIRRQRLKKADADFKVREIHHIKFQKAFFCDKNIKISTIGSKCLYNHIIRTHTNISFTTIRKR